MGNSIEETIEERGGIHGDYRDYCNVAETIEASMRSGKNWASLNPCQSQALKMIASKISRILNGDPDHSDHWHDIAGYATLAEKNLNTGGAMKDPTLLELFIKNGSEKTATGCRKYNES